MKYSTSGFTEVLNQVRNGTWFPILKQAFLAGMYLQTVAVPVDDPYPVVPDLGRSVLSSAWADWSAVVIK